MKNDEANLTLCLKKEHNKVSHETELEIPTNHSPMYE